MKTKKITYIIVLKIILFASVAYSANAERQDEGNPSMRTSSASAEASESTADPRFRPFKRPYYFVANGAGFYIPSYGLVGGAGLSFNYYLKGNSMMSFPQIIFGTRTMFMSDNFYQEASLTFAPSMFFSFKIAPFYTVGWRYYDFDVSHESNYDKVKDKIKANDVSINSSFGLKASVVLNFFFVVITNDFTLYNFKNRVYVQKEGFLIKNDLIWSPKIAFRFRLAKKLNMSFGYSYSTNLDFHGYSHTLMASFFIRNIYSTVSINVIAFYKFKSSDLDMAVGMAPVIMARF